MYIYIHIIYMDLWSRFSTMPEHYYCYYCYYHYHRYYPATSESAFTPAQATQSKINQYYSTTSLTTNSYLGYHWMHLCTCTIRGALSAVTCCNP
jgi:hypothetical protein